MDIISISLLIAALVSLYKIAGVLWRKKFVDCYDDDIPTIVPPLRSDPNIPTHRSSFFAMKALGLVFRTVNPVNPNFVSVQISDPNLLRELWVGRQWELFDRAHPKSPYSEGFISADNGQKWRDTRGMFDRTFSTSAVRKLAPILLDMRNVLISRLAETAQKHPDGFDICPLFHTFAFDVVTRLVFGAEIQAQTTEKGAAYPEAFERWQINTTKLTLAIHMFGQRIARWILGRKTVTDWENDGKKMWDLIAENRKRILEGHSRPSIMDHAYEIVREDKLPASMEENDLTKALMSLLFAGQDTTSNSLSFVFYSLSKRPDIQKIIYDEVVAEFGGKEITDLERLEKCKMLNAALRETLRRYPAAPFGTGRTANEDFEVTYTDVTGQQKRVKFTKGTRMYAFIYGAQNFAPLWSSDPSVWTPERFLGDPTGGCTAGLFTYSPFGGGARKCIGERLALGELRLVVASVLREFVVEGVPEVDWKFEEKFLGVIKPNKVMVRLRPRH